MRESWDHYYLRMTDFIRERSKDRSTKVGAVIVVNNSVISTGYNGFPRGVNDDVESRHDRPAKYAFTEHAERNSIYAAAKRGIPLLGATMYCAAKPCADCARAIIQSGITTLVVWEHSCGLEANAQWVQSIVIGEVMMVEAGIEIRRIA